MKIGMDAEKKLKNIAKYNAIKLCALRYLNQPPIVEDDVKGDALIDVTIDVKMEFLEEDVVVKDDVGSMRGDNLDLHDSQEVYEG